MTKGKSNDLLRAEIAQYQRDIEKLKFELERKNHLLKTVFSNLSHEIRTPLNGILGFSELLKSKEITCEEKTLYAGVIEESSFMLMSILNDVFDITRIESGSLKVYPEEFDLNNLLFELFMMYKEQAEVKGLQFFLENLISDEFIIESSPDVVKRILIKLIDNAIKFTKQGWIKVHYRVEGAMIHFLIEDTGIGISGPVPEKLFSHFTEVDVSTSRNISGTGIDLSLCKGLVKLLDGQINYESKESGGSIFHFNFLNHKEK